MSRAFRVMKARPNPRVRIENKEPAEPVKKAEAESPTNSEELVGEDIGSELSGSEEPVKKNKKN